MKFESFAQLTEAIKSHPEFSNEIKLKRLKKELEILSIYQNPSTSIESIELTSIGIELLVKLILTSDKKQIQTVLIQLQNGP